MANVNDFDFLLLTPGDFGEVTEFLAKEYFTREPLTLGTQSKDIRPTEGRIGADIRKCLESGASMGVRHRPTGELVGVSTCIFESQEKSSTPTHPANELTLFYRMYDEVMKGVEVFEEKEVNKVLSVYMLGVHRGFVGRGLGQRLVELCVAKGVERGCQRSVVCITSKFSYKIFAKLGYEVRHCLDLTSLGPDWGVDTSLMNGNTLVSVMAKRLS
ncbi:arylalkylamine N-acetyltransferase-like 2 [Penaeus chinensis]|uniref:arylalkylamine N-acetyltransferase-like 2 n=1 Tax=Penaeus chinensis TaxID=139456 RepID=UPI001FB6AB09|nr:arylalkylamine N-acetyltransferase-like 2 [Penaeus chinensis]XP_047497143.1 arylalkylamine N-acetyltransferase-like 2 [Penaeus chinensis]